MASVYINLPTVTTSAPVGGATEAKQDVGNASLASIDSKLTDVATETTLSSIDTKTPALGQALETASVPVVLTAAQLTTLTPPAAITGFALETTQSAQSVLIGAVNETAPATDTASSGLNGRLQRIAQRITSLIALFPTSLGTKSAANSLATTWSTEDEALIGALTETAPATDTASSGLNGRLQRVAQRLTSLIALVPTSLGQKTMANSFAVVIASDQSAITTRATVQTVDGTITQAQITVGTSAVRATVAGSAPSAIRKKLMVKPSKNNIGAIYIGASTVTTANGLEIIGPDRLDFDFDSGDYFLISDTAAQIVEILEKV